MVGDEDLVVACFSEAGRLALQQLLSLGYIRDELLVLTYERQENGRNERLIEFLNEKKIRYLTSDIESQTTYDKIVDFDPELLLSVYYRDIVPKRVLNLFSSDGINIHPSLLPEYAGTFSIPWMIIHGEDEAGFTYHYMVEDVDQGGVILQESINIEPNDTAYSLYHRIMYAALSRLPFVLEKVLEKKVEGRSQEGEGSYFSRELPYDGTIDPDWDEEFIKRFIRAMYFPPFRPAVVQINGTEYEVTTFRAYKKLIS